MTKAIEGQCAFCRHYPNQHSKQGKGKCLGYDTYGSCPCPHWMNQQEADLQT